MTRTTINWKKLFYCNNQLPKATYSETPSGDLNPTRLLDNLPAFKSGDGIQQAKKRVIALPAIDFASWAFKLENDAAQYVIHLLYSGFTVIYSTGDKIKEYTDYYTFINSNTEQTLSLSDYSKQSNILADELYLFTAGNFKQCVIDAKWEWEHYDSFETIALERHPISNESLNQLLEQHGDEIRTLELSVCHNIGSSQTQSESSSSKSIRTDIAFNLKDLKRLKLGTVDLPAVMVGRLIDQATELEELELSNLDELHGYFITERKYKLKKIKIAIPKFPSHTITRLIECAVELEELSLINTDYIDMLNVNHKFKKLKKIEIHYSKIHADTLQQILEEAKDLEELSFKNAHIKGILTLYNANLRKLKKIKLFGFHMPATALQYLFEQAADLEVLKFTQFDFISTEYLDLSRSNLTKLKKLRLLNSRFPATAIKHLLEHAPELEELSLEHLSTSSNFHLYKPQLSKLKKINLSDFYIASDDLQCILEHTPELEELYIQHLGILGTVNLQQANLTKLKKIRIDYAKLDAFAFQPILEQASELEELMLNGIKHIDLVKLDKSKLIKLKKLSLHKCNISANALQNILESAINLDELELNEVNIFGELTLNNSNFTKLKTLHLNKVNLPKAVIQSLLDQPIELHDLHINNLNGLEDVDLSRVRTINLHRLYIDLTDISNEQICDFHSRSTHVKSSVIGLGIKRLIKTNPETHMTTFDTTINTRTIDANTHFNKNKMFHLEQQFIGKHHQPHPAEVRLNAYADFTLNPKSNGIANPFILTNKTPQLDADFSLNAKASKSPLYSQFTTNPAHDYFGRFKLRLTNDWQPLPSLSAQETLQAYYLDQKIPIELVKSPEDGFYYVRLANHARMVSCNVTMEIVLQEHAKQVDINDLPNEIKSVIRDCRGYRDADLTIPSDHTSAKGYLNAIIKQRTGACRHRSIVFKALMKKRFPNIKVQIIENDCHMFAEIFYQDQWVSCDLGGYEAAVEIQNNVMPESVKHEEKDQRLNHPERVYHQTLSNRGTIPPHGYWRKLTNLTTFTLDQINFFPENLNTKQLDTLIIKDADITAKQLHHLLERAPRLKTLKLLNIRISKDEFKQLNFSMLKHIEFIQLTGSFIPNLNELTRLKQTTDTTVHWAIDSANVYDDKQNSNDIEVEATEPIKPIDERKAQPKVQEQTPSPIIAEIKQSTPPIARKPKRVIPNHRYFKTPVKRTVFDYIDYPKKSTLLKTSNPQPLGYALQHYCETNGYPYFYIDQAWELACSKPIIDNQDNKGIIKRGPAGAFYDFIQAHKLDKHNVYIIINYANFTPADIARFNTLLDDHSSVDGVTLSNKFKIIGLNDPNSPDCYQGADLYSRFKHRTLVDTLPETNLPTIVNTTPDDKTNEHIIELCGGGDWEARLLGHWRVKGDQLIFKPGKLTKAVAEGKTNIIFNNPPVNDPDFNRFLQESAIHQALFYHGHAIKPLPTGFQINITHDVSFPDVEARIHTQVDHPDNEYHVLNSASLSHFLGIYAYDKQTKGLMLATGLIKQNRDRAIAVYLTHSLSDHEWLRLFEAARLYNTTFDLRLAPGVSLPDSFKLLNKPKPHVIQQLPDHTTSLFNKIGELDTYPSNAIVIDVTELTPADLLHSLHGHFDEANLKFDFSEKPSYLITKLAKKKTIILKGKWSNELARSIQGLLYERSCNANALGNLVVVSDNEQTFPGIPTTKITNLENSQNKLKYPRKKSVAFDERLPAIETILKDEPFVVITGDTGTGKTYFMEHEWKAKHRHAHFGEKSILDWILDGTPGLKILFIDEANLTGREWSELSGLRLNPPAIFYQGKYYPLSKDHKVIFACNQESYGGERQLPRLFEQAHCELEFKPIPHQVTLSSLNLTEAISRPILKAAEYLSSLSSHEIYITPRELIMMAALTQATLKEDDTLDPSAVATYFAYEIGSQHLSPGHKQVFANKFKPEKPIHCKAYDLKLKNIVLTEANTSAFHALIHQLNLRTVRTQETSGVIATGGLGGLIIEGEPGIGKSELIIDVLNAKGLIRDQDYYYIPVAMNQAVKEALLIKAFHEGKIVIIDEINSSPLLERLMNALLEGHDLENKSANQPGFLLLGTQNPTHFSGRRATTLPVKHRLQTVVMPEYPRNEMINILIEKQIPPRIAQDMTAEYLANKKQNSELCFRDLIKQANSWLKHHKHDKKIRIHLKSLPQVGNVCKIVSIANIDHHYAKQCGYDAIPLNANNKDHHGNHRLFSIRKLAKLNGSVQGEILEHKTWAKNFNDLGYETEIVDFNNDINMFIKRIVSALKQGNLPLVGFAVAEDSGQPDPYPLNPEAREHATVICGYNPKTDELTIKHWGNTYEVDAVTLFNSSRALATTRKQEFYHLNPQYSHAKRQEIVKYSPSNKENDRNSLVPAENTGFRAKLLIVKKPGDVGEMMRKRKEVGRDAGRRAERKHRHVHV